jgi:hypothetical protein
MASNIDTVGPIGVRTWFGRRRSIHRYFGRDHQQSDRAGSGGVRRSGLSLSALSVVFGWSQLVLELVSKLVGAGLVHGGLLRAKVYIRKATIPEASPQSPIHIAHKATTSSNQLTVPSPTPPCPAPPPYPTFPSMTSTLEGRRSHSNSWMLP